MAWVVTTVLGLVPAVYWVVDSLRRGEPGVDVIAVLALVGALLVGEFLAGAVIAVMLASGRTLEARASVRAARELTALLSRAPQVAHRYERGREGAHPGCRLLRSMTSVRVTCCWSGRVRSSRSTGWSSAGSRCSTSRR